MRRLILPLLLGLALSSPAVAARYNIDGNHTQLNFTYLHNGFANLGGRLNQVTGTLDFDAAQPAKSSIDVQIPMASLSTGVPRLDTHLLSADFFDAEKFPTASFKSSKVSVLGKDKLSVAGDMTLHGVTRPAVFEVTINRMGMHPMRKVPAVGFEATTTIKRSEFGVGGLLQAASDDVRIRIAMEASEPKPEAAATPAPEK